MSNLLPKNRRRFFFSKRSRGNSRKDCLHTMKILRQQNTNDTESNRSLEQILSVQEDLKNTVEVASYLNNLCATLTSAKELPSEEGFYKAVCKRIARYVLLDVSSIRAITYRILRKASQIHDDLSLLLQIHMDIFAIRSLELDTNSSEERMEALKLCVMMLSRRKERTKSLSNGLVEENFSDTSFPENICRAIISVANSFFPMRFDRAKAKEGEDELAFSCFVVIIEQAAVAPDLILNSIDTGWIVEFLTRTILNDRSSTVVCRILCAWLDSPRLRVRAKLRSVLNRIFFSITEMELFEWNQQVELECLSNNSFHLRNFSQIFSTLLRTWAGLLACAASDDQNTSFVSALSFLDYVGLNPLTHANSRKIYDLVIECCCEVLELSYSKVRFTDWPCTVGFYSTVYHPDAYKCSVRDDFILAEHEMFLRIDQRQTNINDLLVSFRSVVIYMLIKSNVIQALSRVILQDPDDQIALKATLLMHDLLIASSICLPMEWKLHVLSLPTLMHGACELMSSRKHPLDDGQYRVGKISFTYADPRNIIILFNRLDILKNVTLAQKTQPFPITNLELFVQSNSVVTRLSKSTLSRRIFNDNDRAADVGTMLGKLLLKAVGSDGRLCWPIVDKLFQLLENNYACRDVPRKYFEKCYGIFRMVFFFITPVKGLLIKARADRLVIICCCRAIYLSLMFAARETQYKELISNFINDFIMSISGDALLNGPLSPKNLVNSSAMYYFAFVGAISAAEEGRRMLEATTLLQKFTDLVKNTTNVEYVKLIVSCLDYRSEDSFSRFVLETALSSASEAGRKWATRFLSILAVYNNSDFSVWGIKLLLRQLEDPSAKVVRHAVRLLHRWIPYYPKSAYLIKDVCFDAFGDAGTLLKTHLFSDESYVENNFRDTLTTIDYWKKEFNSRYAEIIDEDVRVALLDSKRSIDGRYARCSNERIAKFGVPMPVHLYGQLAQHDTGRKLLLESDEVGRLLDVLRDSPLPTDAYQISEMKGALYALGHTAAGLNPGLLPTETVPIICRFAECCPVLSIRGAAFWVLNLIGNTKLGSVLLSSLGWESSNFIFTEKKTNDFLLQTANNDISKIWIRCMDWNDSLQHGVEPMNEKFLDIKHKNSELITNKRTFSNLMDHLVYRWKGCGLLSLEAVNCSVGIHHGSTSEVENVLFDNDNISTLQKEGEETEDYFIIRSRFRLRPLLLDKLPTFKNFLGTEVKYSSMSEDEFLCYCGFRNLMESEQRKPSNKSDLKARKSQPFNLSVQSISLPRSPDLFCKDIFINEELIKHNCDPSSAAEWQHGMNNCLYCSWPEEYFGSKNDLEVGVSTEARNEIISLFLLQGSKQTMSSKILLKNYLSNRENFSSLCLYSDIVALLAQHDYNTETRRLVHELFANALQNVCICEPS